MLSRWNDSAARRVRLGMSVAIASLAMSSGLEAQDAEASATRPVAEAVRLPDGMTLQVDGRLDEAAWDLAPPITAFRQQEPVEGGVPTEATEVRILYDGEALYIGAVMYDSDPAGILAYQLERNVSLATDDRFMWVLDTFQDGRTGYFFETNPAGLMGDGLIGGGGFGIGVNKSWDGIWEVRTSIHEEGWAAEIRIPFSTLNFDPSRDVWGINFHRTVRRKNEEIRWSGWRRTDSFLRPATAGEVVGLSDLSQGLGVEVKPFLLASGRQEVETGESWGGDTSAGFDVSYSITPALRAAVTVNTDFAEVESDQRRVNLTRFPLRFPERRDFFLEGSGVFSYSWADPFFSRRIGLVEGQEVPIRYGARLGGQVGRYEVGFYQIRTGSEQIIVDDVLTPHPAENFTVGRVKRSMFQQSHVGLIYTRRSSELSPEGGGPPNRHTVGWDLDLYSSEWRGTYNAQLHAFLTYHTDPDVGGDLLAPERRARGIRIGFPNDLISVNGSYRDFGEGWDPAVGFAQRTGFRRTQPTFTVAPRPEWWAAVRQMRFTYRFEHLADMDWDLLTRISDFTFLDLSFESGDELYLEGSRRVERLNDPFRIHGSGEDAIRIPVGDYPTWNWQAGFETAGHRMLSGNVDLTWGEFWSGTRREVAVGGTIRPRRGLSLTAQVERNDVRLAEGAFETNLVRLTGSWNLSPLTSLSANIQYDDVSDVVGLFARARWIVRPGSDVYLVWSHNWRNETERLLSRDFTPVSRGGAIKVNYSHRF